MNPMAVLVMGSESDLNAAAREAVEAYRTGKSASNITADRKYAGMPLGEVKIALYILPAKQ